MIAIEGNRKYCSALAQGSSEIDNILTIFQNVESLYFTLNTFFFRFLLVEKKLKIKIWKE